MYIYSINIAGMKLR